MIVKRTRDFGGFKVFHQISVSNIWSLNLLIEQINQYCIVLHGR